MALHWRHPSPSGSHAIAQVSLRIIFKPFGGDIRHSPIEEDELNPVNCLELNDLFHFYLDFCDDQLYIFLYSVDKLAGLTVIWIRK